MKRLVLYAVDCAIFLKKMDCFSLSHIGVHGQYNIQICKFQSISGQSGVQLLHIFELHIRTDFHQSR